MWFPAAHHIFTFYLVGTTLAGFLALGWWRRWIPIPLLYLWACSMNFAAMDITPVSQW